jgi:hypothetical protein
MPGNATTQLSSNPHIQWASINSDRWVRSVSAGLQGAGRRCDGLPASQQQRLQIHLAQFVGTLHLCFVLGHAAAAPSFAIR